MSNLWSLGFGIIETVWTFISRKAIAIVVIVGVVLVAARLWRR